MSRLVFSAFSNRTDAVELARQASERLAGEGVESQIYFLDSLESRNLGADDLVVSLGGDGTFLRAARLAHRFGARVLATNLGRLGFLLNVPPEELINDIMHALRHDHVVERLALSIALPGAQAEEFALNEVVLERAHAGSMVRVKSFVDDDEFLTYSADGVMVATPTGSTGYNFSAGGPVVEATLPVMMITPIAPHFTIDRTIVVDGRKVVRLVSENRSAEIVADGRSIGTLSAGEAIAVSQSERPVRVVATRSFELGFRLRESLREGHA